VLGRARYKCFQGTFRSVCLDLLSFDLNSKKCSSDYATLNCRSCSLARFQSITGERRRDKHARYGLEIDSDNT